MNEPLRFVIIGSGNISGTYISAVARVEEAVLVAAVSRSGRRSPALPPEIPVFQTLCEVAVPFDAVILCTPNGTHHEWTMEAARVGKHILTEKVLEISRERMDAMCAACDHAGVKLAVAFQRRMSPDNIAIKRLLDAGALGRIFAVEVAAKFYRNMSYYRSGEYRGKYAIDGGGPFIQQAAHQIDLLCWWFGLPEQVLSMLGTFVHDIEAEDHGSALLRYKSGMLAVITASTATKPGFLPRMELHSDKGTVVLENDRIVVWEIDGLERPDSTPTVVHDGRTAAVTDTVGHEAILRDFVDAVRADREPAVPASSARTATELVLRIYEAAAVSSTSALQ